MRRRRTSDVWWEAQILTSNMDIIGKQRYRPGIWSNTTFNPALFNTWCIFQKLQDSTSRPLTETRTGRMRWTMCGGHPRVSSSVLVTFKLIEICLCKGWVLLNYFVLYLYYLYYLYCTNFDGIKVTDGAKAGVYPRPPILKFTIILW